jgi:putative transposase
MTALKATEELAWLNEVSSVPLQQAVRHQQAAYAAFFAQRARYPRFKSRQGRQSAAYTRSGFRWRDGRWFLAKMDMPLAFTWSWPASTPAPGTPGPEPDPLPAADGRCQPGSAYRAKAKAKAARAHRKVRAARADFLHKASTRLVRDHDVIVLEDLAVQNMVRNRRLAKAIADCGWGAGFELLKGGQGLQVTDFSVDS